MAITREHDAFIVTIRRRGRGHLKPPPLIGAAPTRDEARAMEDQMIQAIRDGLPWSAESPAQGTLAPVLSKKCDLLRQRGRVEAIGVDASAMNMSHNPSLELHVRPLRHGCQTLDCFGSTGTSPA